MARKGDGYRILPGALTCLALAAAGCIGDRPTPIDEDQAWIQVSTESVRFEKTAYVPESLTPPIGVVQLAFDGAAAPSGAPFVGVDFGELPDWLLAEVSADSSRWAVALGVPGAIAIESGIYTTTVWVAWQGADNSPVPLDVTLVVHPHPGSWQPGQRSVESRTGHTTTALASGGALVVGGSGTENGIERLDPATGVWTSAGTLVHGRTDHTATLLPTGEVLVAGGLNWAETEHPSGTWEVYDPATESVVATGSLLAARYSHDAVLLHDGRVLIVGGYDTPHRGQTAERTAEFFDPWTRTLAVAGMLHEEPSVPTDAAILADGRVLVTSRNTPGAELFDPSAEVWTVQAPMSRTRHSHMLVGLADGRALVLGGSDVGGSILATEIYDPQSGRWSPAGSLSWPHVDVRSDTVLLMSGRVLVAGTGAMPLHSAVEVFDPSSEEWSVVGTLGSPRAGHTVTDLGDGRVLAVGGIPLQERPEFWRVPFP